MYNYISLGITPDLLIKAMMSENEARMHYQKLIPMASNAKESDILHHIYADESNHFSKFRMLYLMLTRREPVLPSTKKPMAFQTYIEGVEQALSDEIESYEFYRNIYLSTRHPGVRDIFLEAFTDENEHSTNLNYIYSRNKNLHNQDANSVHRIEAEPTRMSDEKSYPTKHNNSYCPVYDNTHKPNCCNPSTHFFEENNCESQNLKNSQHTESTDKHKHCKKCNYDKWNYEGYCPAYMHEHMHGHGHRSIHEYMQKYEKDM